MTASKSKSPPFGTGGKTISGYLITSDSLKSSKTGPLYNSTKHSLIIFT